MDGLTRLLLIWSYLTDHQSRNLERPSFPAIIITCSLSTESPKMIVITGGAGFVGSSIVKELNNRGVTNVVVVDDMTDGSKFRNLVNCKVADYIDATTFREAIRTKTFPHRPRVIFHYGASSSVSETNGKKLLDTNFTYAKELFHWCKDQRVRFYLRLIRCGVWKQHLLRPGRLPRSPAERLWIFKDAV